MATLTNGIVFCRIRSWLTGHRLVSLPFTDHCEPLVESADQRREILAYIERTFASEKLKYVEIRPLTSDPAAQPSLHQNTFYWFHALDLRPSLESLFRRFDKKSVQKRIRRAESEPLTYEEGRSDRLLMEFYHLMMLTRRRHNLPPQPIEWFRNLVRFLGDRLTIQMVSYQEQPVASILTLRHLSTLVYKYGCSDSRYHHLGCMPFLLWKAMSAAKERGIENFDFGRSDPANHGLIQFKDHFGGVRSVLAYERICAPLAPHPVDSNSVRFAKRIFACMPDRLLSASGKLLYRHMA